MPLFGTYLIFFAFIRPITSAFEIIMNLYMVSFNFTTHTDDVTHYKRAGFSSLHHIRYGTSRLTSLRRQSTIPHGGVSYMHIPVMIGQHLVIRHSIRFYINPTSSGRRANYGGCLFQSPHNRSSYGLNTDGA